MVVAIGKILEISKTVPSIPSDPLEEARKL
jgi:hypothetical protein